MRSHVLGALYGIAGKVIDNRRYLLLVDEELTPKQAYRAPGGAAAPVRSADHAVRGGAHARRDGILEVVDAKGNVVGLAQDSLMAETLNEAGFDVRQVEHNVGYDAHGFEDRGFRGTLQLTVDRFGTLAVMNVVKLEELLKGLVPSEIYARAHMEALKAQAVTARGEVLAKVGIKHLADPYLLCSEQHCAVYRGRTGEAASTTRGGGGHPRRGALLEGRDGWWTPSTAPCAAGTRRTTMSSGTVRRTRACAGSRTCWSPPLTAPTPTNLQAFLAATDLPAACRLSSFARRASSAGRSTSRPRR